MKRKITKQLLTCILVLIFALQGAGCGGILGNSRESIREKLLLAYQYLENMEFDSALDAFAAVIEIDEKIPEAYVGMARAYSAKGDHAMARETAAKGKEMTEVSYFDDLERMYGKISDNEDTIREIAELLKEGDEKIPGELEESISGILSEALDRLWEKLDQMDIYDVIDKDTLVYPVDPEKSIYLILYPDGQFYLGEVLFIPVTDLLALVEDSSEASKTSKEEEETEPVIPALPFEDLVFPILEGHGILAGFNDTQKDSELYIGEWKNSLPDGQGGIYAYQYLEGGARYVYQGVFSAGSLTGPNAVYGSTERFLEYLLAALQGTAEESVEDLYNEIPMKKPTIHDYRISHAGGQYTSDFEYRDLFELIDQGRTEEALQGLNELKKKRQDEENLAIKKSRQEISPVPIDGALLYVDSNLRVTDYDLDHGVYFTIPFMKDTYIPLYVLNGLGESLLRTYERMVWLTESGFSALFMAEEGSDQAYSDSIWQGVSGQGKAGDLYQIDYDWEGNEIKRTLLGKLTDLEKYTRYEQHSEVSTYSDMVTAPGSPIRAEQTNGGIRVTDSDGNSLGTISVEEPSQWSIQINGKMILINNQADYKHYLFAVWND